MPILSYNVSNMAQVGIAPRRATLISSDDYDTITSAGYINLSYIQLMPSDEVVVYYNSNMSLSTGDLYFFRPSIANGVVTLVPPIGPPSPTPPPIPIYGTTDPYGGGFISAAYSVNGLTSISVGSVTLRNSTNPVSLVAFDTGINVLHVTFSDDPGADTTVDYIFYSGPSNG